jgi:hypothetical protein
MKRLSALLMVIGTSVAAPTALSAAHNPEYSFGATQTGSFFGSMVVESASAGCGILPFVEQDAVYRMSLKPGGIGSNGPDTEVSFVFHNITWAVVGLHLANGSLPTGTATFIGGAISPQKTAAYSADISVPTQDPPISETSKQVFLRGSIAGVGGVATCTVGFRAALARPLPN